MAALPQPLGWSTWWQTVCPKANKIRSFINPQLILECKMDSLRSLAGVDILTFLLCSLLCVHPGSCHVQSQACNGTRIFLAARNKAYYVYTKLSMRSSNHTKIQRIQWHKNHASADNEELSIIYKTPHFLSSEGNILISPTVSQQSRLIVVKYCTSPGWIWRTRHCGSCLRWLIWWYRCWWIWLLDFILSFTCGVIQNFVSVSMSCGSLGNKPKRIRWRSFLPSVGRWRSRSAPDVVNVSLPQDTMWKVSQVHDWSPGTWTLYL